MAALTLAKIRRFTERALRDNKLDAKIESIEWLGKRCAITRRLGRCEYKEYFRIARVTLIGNDGRRVYKSATIDSNNGFEIK